MNKKVLIIIGVVIVAFVAVLAFTNNSANVQPPSAINTNTQSQNGGNSTTQRSNSAQATSPDPQDVVAGLYPNPIQNTATTEGFKITSIMVENNTDSAGNPVSDHLQLKLQNLTNKDLTNFEVYYTITDTTTNKKEGYYKKLNNFVLKAGATQSINFDTKQGAGHFSVNTHSLYFTSTNKLQFTVMVSTPGYKVETASVTKAAGGAETKD